jgi:hypothetical protein
LFIEKSCFECGAFNSVYKKKIATAFGLAMTDCDDSTAGLFEKTKPILERAKWA